MDEREVFSFHLRRVGVVGLPRALFGRLAAPGLRHAESFFTMQLGEPVLSTRRYGWNEVGTFAWWQNEGALDAFLAGAQGRSFAEAWHVRGRLYRRWGRVSEIDDATLYPDEARPEAPVVAVTLARLRLTETLRFTRWGKPVERQVRDHAGKTLALAAMRPLATFCTFSIWRDEAAMVGMVQGRRASTDGTSHALAMRERSRKDFHHAFTTLRLAPLGEVGRWHGVEGYTRAGP
jgi:hypothetical protein